MNGEMNSIKMREKPKADITVLSYKEEDGSLLLTLSSSDRNALEKEARTFALSFVRNADADAELGRWKSAGAEKVTPIAGYDPENPDADPYQLAAEKRGAVKWHYMQTVKLTNSIF